MSYSNFICNYFDSFRVCELLYEKRRQFDKILSCYLRDPSRKVRNKMEAQLDLIYKFDTHKLTYHNRLSDDTCVHALTSQNREVFWDFCVHNININTFYRDLNFLASCKAPVLNCYFQRVLSTENVQILQQILLSKYACSWVVVSLFKHFIIVFIAVPCI